MKTTNRLILLLAVVLLNSCLEVVDLDLPPTEPQLVVDGLITDGKGPHTVTLSKTSKYTFRYNPSKQEFETGAMVLIKDNGVAIDTLTEVSPGVYQTDTTSVIGKVGHTYTLEIFTAAHKHYISHPEPMLEVPAIDSMYYERNKEDRNESNNREYKFSIYVDWQDPAMVRNYYLRRISYHWAGKWHDNVQWNWVFDDNTFDGRYMKKIFLTDGYGESKFTVQVTQYSLSERAYTFWKLIHQQTQATGEDVESTNSRLPLTGNVFNADNPKEATLGYFQVSAARKKAVFLEY